MVEQKEQLYEGKAKKVYATSDPDLLIVDYKDDATAFNGLKKGTIVGKGVINNRMSNYLRAPHGRQARGDSAHRSHNAKRRRRLALQAHGTARGRKAEHARARILL